MKGPWGRCRCSSAVPFQVGFGGRTGGICVILLAPHRSGQHWVQSEELSTTYAPFVGASFFFCFFGADRWAIGLLCDAPLEESPNGLGWLTPLLSALERRADHLAGGTSPHDLHDFASIGWGKVQATRWLKLDGLETINTVHLSMILAAAKPHRRVISSGGRGSDARGFGCCLPWLPSQPAMRSDGKIRTTARKEPSSALASPAHNGVPSRSPRSKVHALHHHPSEPVCTTASITGNRKLYGRARNQRACPMLKRLTSLSNFHLEAFALIHAVALLAVFSVEYLKKLLTAK